LEYQTQIIPIVHDQAFTNFNHKGMGLSMQFPRLSIDPRDFFKRLIINSKKKRRTAALIIPSAVCVLPRNFRPAEIPKIIDGRKEFPHHNDPGVSPLVGQAVILTGVPDGSDQGK